MGSTYTNNLGLRKPEHRDPETVESWDGVLNNNFDLIDLAFGLRQYTEQNYISNSDSHSDSINKLDMVAKDVSDLAPTADQKAALVGEGVPNASNKYVTKSYARPEQTVVLFPEFLGCTFSEAPGGANVGNITTDSEVITDRRFNFYEWLSAEIILNNYDLVVQWKVPATFLNWTATPNKALIIDINTDSITPADSHVDVELQKDGVALLSTLSNKVSIVATAWNAERFGNEVVYFGGADPVLYSLTPGDVLNIRITLHSKNSNKVKVSAITLRFGG